MTYELTSAAPTGLAYTRNRLCTAVTPADLRCLTTVCWPNHNWDHEKALLLTQTLQLLRLLVALRAVDHHCSSASCEFSRSCKQAMQYLTTGQPLPHAARYSLYGIGMHPSRKAHCKLLAGTNSACACCLITTLYLVSYTTGFVETVLLSLTDIGFSMWCNHAENMMTHCCCIAITQTQLRKAN